MVSRRAAAVAAAVAGRAELVADSVSNRAFTYVEYHLALIREIDLEIGEDCRTDSFMNQYYFSPCFHDRIERRLQGGTMVLGIKTNLLSLRRFCRRVGACTKLVPCPPTRRPASYSPRS